jgi:hypothetical protein
VGLSPSKQPERGGSAGLALRRAAAAAVLAAVALGISPVARPALQSAQTVAGGVLRRAGTWEALAPLQGWPRLTTAHFRIAYPPGSAEDARVVADVAERFYPQVAADFGLEAAGPWPVVVAGAAAICRAVGCTDGRPPLGAYYRGVIWLLAPSAFLRGAGPDLAAAYAADGPVPHELTHLADDLASGGRVPAWLDEGLAQYEQWRLTGYVWVEADNGFSGPVYGWNQLTADFVRLPNQALAYRQALAVTAALCRTGSGVCLRVLHELRAGVDVLQALRSAVGDRTLRDWEGGAAWRPGREPLPGRPAGPPP